MQQLSGKIRWQQVQDNGLASSNDLHWSRLIWKEIVFLTISHFEMQRTERVIHYLLTIALQIMLDSFRATPEWLHTSSLPFYFTCNFEEQNVPFTPIFRHIRTRCVIVYSLMSLSLRQIKPSMSALECQCCSDWAVSWNLVGSICSAYGVVMRWLLRMQLFCHRWRRGSPQCTVCS